MLPCIAHSISPCRDLVVYKTTTITTTRFFFAIDKIAENQIAEWLRRKDDQQLPHGKKLAQDPHKTPAKSLELRNDYVHSKILADNNIRPESVQRRIDLDAAWEVCAREIRENYVQSGNCSVDEYVNSCTKNKELQVAMETSNRMAKRVNDAIIDDSIRFGGRSSVRHARSFLLDVRVREAIDNSQK
jgi:hypothetical protein